MLLVAYREKMSAAIEEEGADNLYFVLDSACEPELPDKIWELDDNFNPQCESLFRGTTAEDLFAQAPYLIKLEPDSTLYEWLLNKSCQEPLGFFAFCSENIAAYFVHLQRVLEFILPNKHWVHIRYYNPTLLRLLSRTLACYQLNQLIGPATRLIGADLITNELFDLSKDGHNADIYETRTSLVISRQQFSMLISQALAYALTQSIQNNFKNELGEGMTSKTIVLFNKLKKASSTVDSDSLIELGYINSLVEFLTPISAESTILSQAILNYWEKVRITGNGILLNSVA
ncbi:DUF4123 domain-containing protein [Zooshikella harenae]|uniref:DUF4123 domain-containing protein n=1 Tax=Zooshikella harenae TaxID=2827238 RepID=A0ABS5ZFK6_9GAMM|nr:DUF4123 domain-containing protein [Zooshikella harenae]MBU2712847.1 DUF4123 domain-containing protein [Zooshikella harenae]